MIRKVIFFILLFFFTILSLSADQRTINVDIYIVLDKSLSMVEEIESVKEYVIDNIIDKLLISGDKFTLIPFFGQSSVAFSGKISTTRDKSKLKEVIKEIIADGHFTDIGNALDTLKFALSKDNRNLRKYLLLITDGKQEAPPDSKYYSPDHKFNHEFLKNVKVIQKQGWKIEILGIGTQSVAKALAEELSAEYTEVSTNASPEEINKKMGNLLGTIKIKDGVKISKINKSGKGKITFTLVSQDYDNTISIGVKEIILAAEGMERRNILSNPVVISVPANGETKISLDVHVPIPKKDYTGEVTFKFNNGKTFSPAVQEVRINTESSISPVLFVLFALLILAVVVFVRRNIISSSVREEEDKNKNQGL